jgi:hypothetical protein
MLLDVMVGAVIEVGGFGVMDGIDTFEASE